MIAPPATEAPYAETAEKPPASLPEALQVLRGYIALYDAFGSDFTGLFDRIKPAEITRHAEAEDKGEWQRREYFGRI